MFHNGFLVGVYVSEPHRGQGFGLIVVKFVISEVRKLDDVSKIQLRVTANNSSAKKLYLNCGFYNEGFEKDVIRVNGTSYDEHLMVSYLWPKT